TRPSARDCADDPVWRNHADAMVLSIGDIDVAVCIECHATGSIQLRGICGTAIAAESGSSGASDGCCCRAIGGHLYYHISEPFREIEMVLCVDRQAFNIRNPALRGGRRGSVQR